MLRSSIMRTKRQNMTPIIMKCYKKLGFEHPIYKVIFFGKFRNNKD